LNYSKITSISLDPIEKKPLYHFYPGKKTLSVGSFGCNMKCLNCQNYLISNADYSSYDTYDIFPDYVIEIAKDKKSDIISYTYNEPTVFYEFMIETAILARKNGMKNVLVSNGFINREPLEKLMPYIDAANIDLKSFSDDFYKSVCFSRLNDVLETLKLLVRNNIHLEISYLVIPSMNDSSEEIRSASRWIKENLGRDIPLHFNRFFPLYKMSDKEMTPIEILFLARDIAKEEGLRFVYIGNVDSVEDTRNEISRNIFCPSCKKIILSRDLENNCIKHVHDSIDKIIHCSCGEKIYGKF